MHFIADGGLGESKRRELIIMYTGRETSFLLMVMLLLPLLLLSVGREREKDTCSVLYCGVE